ncbi:MAG: arylsulfatase [Bacteroidota bacterium]
MSARTIWMIVPLLSIVLHGCKSEMNPTGDSPNVIIVLIDDQGYGDIGAHGNPVIHTPHLDEIYQQSIHFTQFHVSPMCTPTRGELLTGQDAFRNGAVFVTQGNSHMHKGIPTIADVFAANGYATGHFGKWHLGDNYPYRPQDRGFQETLSHGAWGVTSMVDYWSNDYQDDTYFHNGEFKQYEGFCTDVWFNESMKWMEEQAAKNQPFLTYLATNVPHVPLIVDAAYMHQYDGSLTNANTKAFFGMITQLDENMGRMEQFLSEKGLLDNTLFIFMSDNGTAGGEQVYNAGMRGKKRSYYDGGHRVPFWLRWPAKGIGGGGDIDELAFSTDVFPTLMGLCGFQKTDGLQFDGEDLSEIIRGKEIALADRMKVISYQELDKENSAVLWNAWRLVNYTELYHIEDDPGQQQDVADKHTDIVRAMQEYYDAWYNEVVEIDKQVDLISIGTDYEPETFLCSANWTGDYADSWRNIFKEPNLQGYYSLEVESTGKYEVALYRWPKESQLTLTDDFYNINIAHDATHNLPGKHADARLPALSVKAARLTIDQEQFDQIAAPEATHVSFELDLQKGQLIKLEAVLLDETGEELCGAYFTYVKKIEG